MTGKSPRQLGALDCIFYLFFYIVTFDFTYLHLLKNSKIFCDVLYRLEIYQFILFFFKK